MLNHVVTPHALTSGMVGKMLRSRSAPAVVVACLVQLVSEVRADTVVADNLTPAFQISNFETWIRYYGSSNDFSTNSAAAQRFVASKGGALTSVSTPGATLGEKSFSAVDFPADFLPPNPLHTLDLSSLNISLEA